MVTTTNSPAAEPMPRREQLREVDVATRDQISPRFHPSVERPSGRSSRMFNSGLKPSRWVFRIFVHAQPASKEDDNEAAQDSCCTCRNRHDISGVGRVNYRMAQRNRQRGHHGYRRWLKSFDPSTRLSDCNKGRSAIRRPLRYEYSGPLPERQSMPGGQPRNLP